MAETRKQQYQAGVAERLFRAGKIGGDQLKALLDAGAIALEGYQRIWERFAADGYDMGALDKAQVAAMVADGRLSPEAYERVTGEPYDGAVEEGD